MGVNEHKNPAFPMALLSSKDSRSLIWNDESANLCYVDFAENVQRTLYVKIMMKNNQFCDMLAISNSQPSDQGQGYRIKGVGDGRPRIVQLMKIVLLQQPAPELLKELCS